MRKRHTFTATILVALLAIAGVTAAIAADPPPPRIVFVANGRVPADALAAGPTAGQLGAPIFTTEQETLPDSTRDALDAYNPELVIVLGGPVAISDAVVAAISAATGLAVVDPDPAPTTGVVRAAGEDRFLTAAAIADLLGDYNPAALPADAKAVDSDKLDGKDSSAFQPAGDYLGTTEKAADSDKLDGLEPTALSVQGYEQVFGTSVTLANPGDIASASATCPAGKAIIGGGHTTTDGVYTVEVFRSRPISDQTWQATGENISGSNNRTFRAFAICAVVTP